MCACAPTCLTLRDPKDCSLPGSSVHGIFQARTLEQVAISYTREYSWLRGGNWALASSALTCGLFATGPPEKPGIWWCCIQNNNTREEPRWQRTRTGGPLSPLQTHRKEQLNAEQTSQNNFWSLAEDSRCPESSPMSSKGGRTKYKR